MRYLFFLFFILTLTVIGCGENNYRQRVFDVHLHGSPAPGKQLADLFGSGVRTVAVSTSWREQQTYQSSSQLKVLHGLMVPCPNGKVPYSGQNCFEDGKEWPEPGWVEEQVKEGKIDFIGEVLTQYQGISLSDTLMYPYYAIAEKYSLPVGVHTGSAGPDHGCPGFKEEMGNPVLLVKVLQRFPKLHVWLMHGGGPFVAECINMMKAYPRLYADISVLNNPDITPATDFGNIMKSFIAAGLEDRLLFGSDNAAIPTVIASVHKLAFLSENQKRKIFFENASVLFRNK
ncbi:amidohydrolase family protein [Niabella yanshanensis]|uniref:Amidohydrolase family protein n=1 Tax=Niabella yanshanensis TaxID=577386 RepID=A0ABZ0W399_9BACT|nr:amidohydrolase family protein [Niabella yanshanensis]WQD37745.1 amidohydrolase family protein [Niabella yanshanensis]